MVGATRSGWTAESGHINEPNLGAPAAVQNQFYEDEFRALNPTGQVGLLNFERPERLRRWATLGDASARRAERAFFKMNRLEVFVHTNWPDKDLVDLSLAPPPPLFNGMEDFSRQLQSRRTQRFTRLSFGSFQVEPSLLRMAKTSGVLAFKSRDEREQRWLETRGPIIRGLKLRGKYDSQAPFSGSPAGGGSQYASV